VLAAAARQRLRLGCCVVTLRPQRSQTAARRDRQHGGWKTLGSQTGDPFANQGDYVDDGVQGSAPFAGQALCAQAGGRFVVGGGDDTLWQ
jgi:hypothetical protein